MDAVALILSDIDAIGRRSVADPARVLARVADLFEVGIGSFDLEQVGLFDIVFERLAAAVDERARRDLSRRLAPLDQGPKATLRRLAHDEIVVARPVLTTSRSLDDQDLMAVAVARGRDHMLAICERSHLAECVSDVLVARGDAVVHHAIVANPAARFSRLASATLLGRSRDDEGLLALLGERGDLPDIHRREIHDMSRDVALRCLSASGELSAGDVMGPLAGEVTGRQDDVRAAMLVVSRLGEDSLLDEARLAAFARDGRWAETVAALAYMSGLPAGRIDTRLGDGDDDLLIVVGRAREWSFETVRAVLTARTCMPDARALRRAEQTYESLSPSTATRILHVMKLRETVTMRSVTGRLAIRNVER